MKYRHLMLLPFLACPLLAHADIYKRIEPDGTVTYSNTPLKGGKKVDLQPLTTTPAYKADQSEIQQVNKMQQKNRDDLRRKILQGELEDEQKQLDEAKQNLKDIQDNPRHAYSQGHSFINQAAQDEAVKAAQDQVTQHENNVKAIQQELSRIRP